MENWRPEEEKIIKDVRNLVRLKKEIKQLKIQNNTSKYLTLGKFN